MTRRRKLELILVGLTIAGLVWGGSVAVQRVRDKANQLADT